MTTKDLQNKKNVLVKVIFKPNDERYPMIGKIVDLKDSNDLQKRNMVRFVNQSKLDHWIDSEPSIGLTRIFVVSDFTQVIKM